MPDEISSQDPLWRLIVGSYRRGGLEAGLDEIDHWRNRALTWIPPGPKREEEYRHLDLAEAQLRRLHAAGEPVV
jgi:hypothetical protein